MCLNNCKILALSDLHGNLIPIQTPFDLMLIAGDTVELTYQRYKDATVNWYTNDFVDWINNLPFKDEQSKVVFICGNHEVGFEKLTEFEKVQLLTEISNRTNGRVIYLENQLYLHKFGDKTISIFGTPYCKIFGRWAYMRDPIELNDLYSKIPENVDILLTHDAPYGVSDICFQLVSFGRSLENLGNSSLRNAILEKNPKVNIHGHLHSSNHDYEILGTTKVVNVSILDENYDVVFSPLEIDWDFT